MYRKKVEFTIIGAGISGLLTALELVRAGAEVRVVEKGLVGQESSWAGGGILSPLYPWRYPEPVSVLSKWSQAAYPQLSQELSLRSGIDPEWTQNGLLLLDRSDKDAADAWSRRFNANLYQLDGEALLECEPALSKAYHHTLWMPDVAQVRNPRFMQALYRTLTEKGVQVIEKCEVISLAQGGGRVQAVDTSRGLMETEHVIVTAGAWSGSLFGGVLPMPPVAPVKGQMLLFRAAPGTVSRIILGKDRYVIPRRDGRILVGSTMEDSQFDKSTTESAKEEIMAAACALVPELGNTPLERQWAGLRPGSPTGVPYIGGHPSIDGLYFNTGHFRNGVVMGPASARLLADLLLGREPIVDPEPFRLTGMV